MPVEPVSDSVGNLRGLVNHKRDWTRGSFLRAEKRCERGTDENQDMSFHFLSLLFIDWTVAAAPLFDSFGKNSALSRGVTSGTHRARATKRNSTVTVARPRWEQKNAASPVP